MRRKTYVMTPKEQRASDNIMRQQGGQARESAARGEVHIPAKLCGCEACEQHYRALTRVMAAINATHDQDDIDGVPA